MLTLKSLVKVNAFSLLPDGFKDTQENMEAITKCQCGTKSLGTHGKRLNNVHLLIRFTITLQLRRSLRIYQCPICFLVVNL